ALSGVPALAAEAARREPAVAVTGRAAARPVGRISARTPQRTARQRAYGARNPPPALIQRSVLRFSEARLSKDGGKLGVCGHPSRRSPREARRAPQDEAEERRITPAQGRVLIRPTS